MSEENPIIEVTATPTTASTTALATVVKPEPVAVMTVTRPPEVVLDEARKAAVALKQVLDAKPKKIIMNGEQYLEFEDWQLLARFYGLSVRVVETKPVDFKGVTGFEARAEVISTQNGMVVSGADAMCLNNEPNWANKSKNALFQLRSMAQTRASAKALRNALAWVVVLAGYKPTPAEEMTAGADSELRTPTASAAPKSSNPQDDGDLGPSKAAQTYPPTERDPEPSPAPRPAPGQQITLGIPKDGEETVTQITVTEIKDPPPGKKSRVVKCQEYTNWFYTRHNMEGILVGDRLEVTIKRSDFNNKSLYWIERYQPAEWNSDNIG